MDNQVICNKCVMNISASEITFENGVCNFCNEYQKTEVKRKAETLHPGRTWLYYALKKGKKYDVLLGLSGGVDSSTCLHYLVENGIRPLTFSVDNGYNKDRA